MVDYQIRKGNISGKPFVIFICNKRHIVDGIGEGIKQAMLKYELSTKKKEEDNDTLF